ncbi:hypothetical protein Tco_0670732 [Tanacetum coccineum]
MKKMYCLVVTDDYSRFSWVFFLATKDETSGILKSVNGVENLINLRVNGSNGGTTETEFKIRRSGKLLNDIDALTKSMNYKPIVAGNQLMVNAEVKAYVVQITTARRITTVRRIKTSKEIKIVWRTRILTKIRIDQGLGSTSGIRAFALRIFDLEVMEFESAYSNTTAKLPILKLGSRRLLVGFLPPEWNTHVVVWMNKAEIKTMSIDDLYNNFKIVEQSVKKSVGASSGAQNLDFMTAPSTSSTNNVNTAKHAYEVSTVSANVNTASPQVSTSSFSNNVVYAFMVENPNGSNLLQQDLEQIHEDDLEAMDLKWQLSLLSMRAKSELLKSEFEKVKQEKEGIEFKIEKFDKASKDLDKLLGSQITDKSKKGLGYNVVPPPHPLIYNRPKKLDLSYSGLDEFKDPEFKSYGSEDSKQESNIVCDKKSDDSKENSDDSLVKEQVSEDTSSFVESSLNVDKETVFLVDKKIEFSKSKNHEKPVKKSVRYAEMYRSQSPRGNQRNWNNLKSQQLGSDFVMYNKACFICGSFDHVQAHCKYHQRERMVYGNNYNRVNYNYTTNRTHPNAQRNMVPRAVLMKTGLKSFNTARTVNTAHPKSIVYSAKPIGWLKAHTGEHSFIFKNSREFDEVMLHLEEEHMVENYCNGTLKTIVLIFEDDTLS